MQTIVTCMAFVTWEFASAFQVIRVRAAQISILALEVHSHARLVECACPMALANATTSMLVLIAQKQH